MTGPAVYTKAINLVHKNLYNHIIQHDSIDSKTDITFASNGITYRLYGIDYNTFFSFRFPESNLLYINKKHWRQEEKEKPLLK